MKDKEWKARVETRNAKKRKAEESVEKAEADADKDSESAEEEEHPKGVLIKLTGIPDGYTREVIKDKWYEATKDSEKFRVSPNN